MEETRQVGDQGTEGAEGVLQCDVCSRWIAPGEPYRAINYHAERMDPPGVIEIDRAVMLFAACAHCAPSEEQVTAVLRAGGIPVPEGAAS